MSTYPLTDETSIDVLIFWIESTDGNISFSEQDTVKRVLSNMDYTLETYHKTLNQIAAMSTANVEKLIDEALVYVRSNFSDSDKKLTYSLLETIAHCEGKISKAQQEKLILLKKEIGL